ncbi:MAG TPA: TetR/AcrR family transcriptional regulator [Actinoplanes sp.]|nr:TetR/AcrR family transcriptional regulator [Actinoplanes sp.]
MSKNPMAVRSRNALVAAATALLLERAASEISIKDVVETAGMSRPTFYQHFADLGAVFTAAGLAFHERIFAGLEPPPEASAGLREAFVPALAVIVDRMQEHALFYCRVNTSAGGPAFYAGLVAFTSRRLRSEPLLQEWAGRDDVFWDFLGAGVMWVITRQMAASYGPEPTPNTAAEDLAQVFANVFVPERKAE